MNTIVLPLFRKFVVSLFVLLFFQTHLFAQDSILDSVRKLPYKSLENIISKNKNDKENAAALIRLSIHYFRSDLDKSEKYARKALAVSNQINYQEGIAWSYYNLSYCQSNLGNNVGAIKLILKSLKIGEKINNNEIKLESIITLASIYDDLEDYPKAFEYSNEGYKIT